MRMLVLLSLAALLCACKAPVADVRARASAALLVEDWATARPLLEELVEREPRDPDHRMQLGRAYELAGDLPGALEAYEHACRLAPERVDLLIPKGVALLRNGDAASAVAELRAATRREPGNAYAQGWLAAALSRVAGAEENLEGESLAGRLLEVDERNLGALVALATLRHRRGLQSEARALVERARSEAPGDPIVSELVAQVARDR